jgi:hypothetical protein
MYRTISLPAQAPVSAKTRRSGSPNKATPSSLRHNPGRKSRRCATRPNLSGYPVCASKSSICSNPTTLLDQMFA